MFAFWVVFFLLQANVYGQSGDYESRPVQEVEYSQLEVLLETGFETGVIRGEATYFLHPKHAYVDRLQWQARNIEIESIYLNGEGASYEQDKEELTITFTEFLPNDETTEIRVVYKAEPTFGVHFKPNGTVFTSNLPGSVSHWLPGPIHPRGTMPVRFEIEVPDGMKALSSGDLIRQSPTERGTRFIRASEQKLPISELAFAAGTFVFSETYSGTKSLGIYHEDGLISDGERQELLGALVRRSSQMERHLRSELPVNSFNVLVLQDDRWETRPYAAGMGYIFLNQNQESTQLDRSITSQWFGISLRPEQWNDIHFVVLLQAALAEEMGIPDWQSNEDMLRKSFDVPETVYQNTSMDHWQWARNIINNSEDPVFVHGIRESIQEMATLNRTWTNHGFSDFLYDKTGRWMEVPSFRVPVSDMEYRYRVIIEEVRGSDKYTLEFKPETQVSAERFSFKVYWTRDGRIFESTEQFNGAGDKLEIDPGGHVNNLWVESSEDSPVLLKEEKSFSLWLYQIRRDNNPERRKRAAEALRNFSTDPDLQLALQDRFGREEDPEVKAAILRVLADITSGASGTERRFLEGITSSDSRIRMVSMEALKAYMGNQRVEDEVLRIIQTSDDINLVNHAIITYRHLLDEEKFRDFALQFLVEDRQDLLFTETLLQELFELPPTDEVIEMAQEYLHDGYSFDLRWLAYQQLRTHAGRSGWQKTFVDSYAGDSDPRIRFLSLFSLSGHNLQERALFFEERMLHEYDIRILTRLNEMLTSE